jgi:hypothetical protein
MKKLSTLALLVAVMALAVPAFANGDNETGRACPHEFSPVCGSDNHTYANSCIAEKHGVTDFTEGACKHPRVFDKARNATVAVKRAIDVCQAKFGKNETEVEAEAAADLSSGETVEDQNELVAGEAEAVVDEADAVIEEVEAVGGDASALEGIHDEMHEVIDRIRNAATREERAAAVADLRALVREFRDEAHTHKKLESRSAEVRAKAREAREKALDKVKERRKAIIAHHGVVALRVFDLHVCLAESKINRLENAGVDVTEARATLEQLKGLRDDLEAAISGGNRTELKRVHREIVSLWKELRGLHGAHVTDREIHGHKDMFDRMKGFIEKLKAAGVDTTEIEAKLADVEAKFDAAREACRAGEVETCKSLLEEAKSAMRELFELVKEQAGQARPDKSGPGRGNRSDGGA